MHLVTLYTAKYLYLVIGLLAFAYWLTLPKKQKLQLAVFGVIAGVVSLILLKIGANFFYDTRPFVAQHLMPIYPHAADNGFPSDHTLLSSFIAVTIFSANKKLGLVLFFLALLVGISRVIGHIHSPIDIIGSIIFTFIGGMVAYYVTPKVMARFKL